MPADTSQRRIGILFVVSTLAPGSPRVLHGARGNALRSAEAVNAA
jgi:hypothetical protein